MQHKGSLRFCLVVCSGESRSVEASHLKLAHSTGTLTLPMPVEPRVAEGLLPATEFDKVGEP